MTAGSEQGTPCRRVGTFTLGVTLVAAGVLMGAAMLWPEADLRWALKLSPLVLISLGVETLLAARRGGKIRYDWVGMLVSSLLIVGAMGAWAVSWYLAWCPERGAF